MPVAQLRTPRLGSPSKLLPECASCPVESLASTTGTWACSQPVRTDRSSAHLPCVIMPPPPHPKLRPQLPNCASYSLSATQPHRYCIPSMHLRKQTFSRSWSTQASPHRCPQTRGQHLCTRQVDHKQIPGAPALVRLRRGRGCTSLAAQLNSCVAAVQGAGSQEGGQVGPAGAVCNHNPGATHRGLHHLHHHVPISVIVARACWSGHFFSESDSLERDQMGCQKACTPCVP